MVQTYNEYDLYYKGAPAQQGSTLIPHFAHWPWPWTQITCRTVAHNFIPASVSFLAKFFYNPLCYAVPAYGLGDVW